MNNIKEAFSNVKKDMDDLKKEINDLRKENSEIKNILLNFYDLLYKFEKKYSEVIIEKDFSKINSKNTPEINKISFFSNQTDRQINQTDRQINQTDIYDFKTRNGKIYSISKGNQGVQTDRQTDRQTNKQQNFIQNEDIYNKKTPFHEMNNALDSIENMSLEIKNKLKKLTKQEIIILLTIYQLDEINGYSNYKLLSEKLNLSESSIRDYVRRLIFKDIPIKKEKINNKEIKISLDNSFKKLTSINTLINYNYSN